MPTLTQDRTPYLAAEKIGAKQSFTPDGFLICADVPIARIGSMDYLETEIPGIEGKDGIIQIQRVADEVFAPTTLASFEGKPVTIDHPSDPEGVTPGNWSHYAKGHASNVRRGTGVDSDLLLADLLITDKRAIQEIMDGLREVSAGYTADYEQVAPGLGVQRNIVGNHIALVAKGRCGPRCAIGDSAMTKKQSWAEKLRQMFMTRDADGFEEAMKEAPTDDPDGTHIHVHLPEAKPETTDEADPAPSGDDKVAQVLAAIMDRLEAVEKAIAAMKPAATEDESGVEGEDDDMEMDDMPEMEAVTQDSSALLAEVQDIRSRAEILVPGVKMLTVDAKAAVAVTSKALCKFRRQVLNKALTGDHAAEVKSVLGSISPTKMTCDAATVAFNAASDLIKGKNRKPAATNDGTPTRRPTMAEVRKQHFGK